MPKPAAPTYSISSFKFQNYKGIKETGLEGLPSDAHWIFLTGENGYGKTSLLQGLAEVLHLAINGQAEIPARTQALLEIEFKKSNKTYKVSFESYPNFNKINEFSFSLVAYGSSRLNVADEASIKTNNNPIRSLFNTRTLLRDIEHYLVLWKYKGENGDKFSQLYENTTIILKRVLKLKKIEIDRETDTVLYYEKDKGNKQFQALPSRELAAGYRNIISMIGDMIIRLRETQGNITNPSDLEGIVIIDELDLHLHPKWQKQLPRILTETFPKIQFIASTHSPIPLLGAPKNSIFLKVNRTKEEGITVERLTHLEHEIQNMLPNTILSSPIFDFTEIFPTTHKGRRNIRTEDSYEEMKINDHIKEKLKGFVGSDQESELLRIFNENKASDEE